MEFHDHLWFHYPKESWPVLWNKDFLLPLQGQRGQHSLCFMGTTETNPRGQDCLPCETTCFWVYKLPVLPLTNISLHIVLLIFGSTGNFGSVSLLWFWMWKPFLVSWCWWLQTCWLCIAGINPLWFPILDNPAPAGPKHYSKASM